MRRIALETMLHSTYEGQINFIKGGIGNEKSFQNVTYKYCVGHC